MKPVREPAVAGRFYPADPAALERAVDDHLGPWRHRGPGRALVAVVSPHAGYVYSGDVAGAAYALLEAGAFERVLVVAPSHRIPLTGSSVMARGAYRTPLGLVPIDEELCEALLARGGGEVVVEPELHRAEHSLEVQLPFLQRTLGSFRLAPVVMGGQEAPHPARLGEAIAAAVRDLGSGARVLLVASTDLSHYYPDDRARALDKVLVDGLARFDPEGISEDLASGRCEACGGGPLVATLEAARRLGADEVEVLSYATSGDASGDRREVVGYVSAAVRRGPAIRGEP